MGDGICNPECRNEDCSFDYCDCFTIDLQLSDLTNVSVAEIKKCNSYNATLCDIKTNHQCVVELPVSLSMSWNESLFTTTTIATTETWIGDNVCDSFCQNEYCNNDGGDCETCDSSLCFLFWEYFDNVANTDNDGFDYLVTQSESCQHWETITAFFGEPIWNCSQFVSEYDRNNDTMLNGYEATAAILLLADDLSQKKAWQLNCSICAPDVATYYL